MEEDPQRILNDSVEHDMDPARAPTAPPLVAAAVSQIQQNSRAEHALPAPPVPSPIPPVSVSSTPPAIAKVATPNDPRQRRDLIQTVNALYTGAVSLGVSRFLVAYPENYNFSITNTKTLLQPIFAAFALISALAMVLDDWRHARWVNEDYGYRLNPDGGAQRFWCDCAAAIVAFFFVSSSFTRPILYCFWMGCLFLVGWYWSWCLRKELAWFVDTNGEFPTNAYKVTLSEALQLVSARDDAAGRRFCATRADYRVAFIPESHLRIAIGLITGWAFLGIAHAEATSSRPGPAGVLVMISRWVNENMIPYTWAFGVSLFIFSKFMYHRQKKDWSLKLAAIRKSSIGSQEAAHGIKN